MAVALPSLFISHGSPELPLQSGPVVDFLRGLSSHFRPPQAILAVSAHWETEHPALTTHPYPATIHDFWGFPNPLYQLRYPVQGSPHLAGRVADLLKEAGLIPSSDPERGLDHGVWTPLLLAYPEANIPVVQLSIQPHLSPEYHWRMGKALAALRQEEVLILASGSATHNLRAFGRYRWESSEPPLWVSQFADWLSQTVREGNLEDLFDYRERAPYASENHPTDEHLLPLFVALGSGGDPFRGQQIHDSYTYGVFSMAAYQFG
ncbi:MAG: class III extradiol ring-cleavage dioxygenase [Cyanobacteriota bacterium]|nr:class III extradiol ring-cleavage dioxygenase [Cyanobacteriota bacterium]